MVCYQKETFHYVFGITKKGNDLFVVLERTENGKSTIAGSEKLVAGSAVQLKVAAQGDAYTFAYSTDGKPFKTIGGVVSGDILSTDVAGGFTGALIGLYATSANDVQVP